MSTDWAALERERIRPQGAASMTQTWADLVFLHSEVDPSWVASLLPSGLEVDTFEGKTYIGLICFEMRDVQPRFLPTFGGWRNFLETNLRVYVRHPEYGPGVWFISLDASSWLPCHVARSQFDLPYYHAEMSVQRNRDLIAYRGTRKTQQVLPPVWDKGPALQSYDIETSLDWDYHPAEPESLDFWLHERYRLYAANQKGELKTAKVHHRPYEIAQCKSLIKSLRLSEPESLNFNIQTIAKTVHIEAFAPHCL